jgi:hypothetical protein
MGPPAMMADWMFASPEALMVWPEKVYLSLAKLL